jgi:hypothetical protein
MSSAHLHVWSICTELVTFVTLKNT